MLGRVDQIGRGSNASKYLLSFAVVGLLGCKNDFKWDNLQGLNGAEVCSQDYRAMLGENSDTGEETIMFRASTSPDDCYEGKINPADGVDANLNITLFENLTTGKWVFGADSSNITCFLGTFDLNGGTPLKNYYFCNDGTFLGGLVDDSGYFGLLIAGTFGEAKSDQCFCYGDDCGSYDDSGVYVQPEMPYPDQEVLTGKIYMGFYDPEEGLEEQLDGKMLLTTFSANRAYSGGEQSLDVDTGGDDTGGIEEVGSAEEAPEEVPGASN
ncbi:MAG: hypothetical protein WCT46_05505 [Candidatus Gracilibacteria bacterium]|jgi:hypothetical protein